MKTALALVLIAVWGVNPAWAQTLPGVKKLDDHWVEGEKKTYRFLMDSTEVGRLEAVLDDVHRGGNEKQFGLSEKLELDLSRLGQDFHLQVKSRLSVSASGHFRATDVTVTLGEQSERIEAAYDANARTIAVTRSGDPSSTKALPVDGPVFALDDFMIDQLELALAMQDISPEKTIVMPVVSPQRMFTTEYEFLVVGRTQVRYGVFTDSVWQIDMVRPAQQTIYIDDYHHLVKLFDPGRNVTVEMVRDPFAGRAKPAKSFAEHINDQMRRLPIYGFYLLVTLVWLAFLGRDGFRTSWSYLLFLLGMLAYPIVFITQAPLQQLYGMKVIAPALSQGRSIFVSAMIPSLLVGIIQETLKMALLLLATRLGRFKPAALISLGAFVGAGFGLIEACHITGPLFQSRVLTSPVMAERIFSILLHVTLGAGMAYGLVRRKAWQFWLAAVGLHALAAYLVIFVQLKVLTVKAFQIMVAVYDLALLAGMVVLQWRFKLRQVKGRRA